MQARPEENGSSSKKQKSKIEKKPIYPEKKQFSSKSFVKTAPITPESEEAPAPISLEEYFNKQISKQIATKEPNNEVRIILIVCFLQVSKSRKQNWNSQFFQKNPNET